MHLGFGVLLVNRYEFWNWISEFGSAWARDLGFWSIIGIPFLLALSCGSFFAFGLRLGNAI